MKTQIDLTGQRFGYLVVKSFCEKKRRRNGHIVNLWTCQCDCGNIVTVDTSKLRGKHTTSCGCLKRKNKGAHFEDLKGRRFGRLTVIRWLEPEERKARQYSWLCRCDCGNEVVTTANKLKNGIQVSCGCKKHEHAVEFGQINRKYKYPCKRLYAIYKSMINRCENPKSSEYKNYGERGITVCQSWRQENGYDSFAEWAFSAGYDKEAKHGECTIERKDVDGNYSPENCIWVTNERQQNNRRDCIFIEYNNEVHTIADWSRILDISYKTLWRKIRKEGKPLEYCISHYK